MPDHFISRENAERDLLAAAAYLAETIKSADGHAEAMSAVVPLYLDRGDVDTAAELANTVDDSFTRDRLLAHAAEKCAEMDDDDYAMQLVEAVEDLGLRRQARQRAALQKAAKGQFEAARAFADELLHPDSVFAGIAVKQAANGDPAAEETLETIEFPDARFYAIIEIAAGRHGRGEATTELLAAAEKAASEIEHGEERIRAITDLGNFSIELGRNDAALAAFEKAASAAEQLDNIHRDAFMSVAAVGLFRAGSLELADKVLDMVDDKTATASALLGFAREFWRRGERADAIDALEEAYAILKSQRDTETRDSRARYALYASVAEQFAGFEKGERAIETALEIVVESEQISALARIAGILTLRKENDEARHALRTISDDAGRVSALILMCGAANSVDDRSGAAALLDEAVTVAETIAQPAPRASALIEIGASFAKLGETKKAAGAAELSLDSITLIRDAATRARALAALSEIYTGVPNDAARATISTILGRA